MAEITYQMILSTLQTAGLLVGIFYYVMTLRNQQKNQEISLKNQELTLKSQDLSRQAQEHALETRQAQLFMSVYKEDLTERSSKSLYLVMDLEYKDLDDFEAKYGKESNPEAHELINFHLNYMEGLGVLVREGYVDIRLVALMTSGGIRLGWEKLKDYVYEARERFNWPRWGIEYEYLYDTMMDYADEHPELQINP